MIRFIYVNLGWLWRIPVNICTLLLLDGSWTGFKSAIFLVLLADLGRLFYSIKND